MKYLYCIIAFVLGVQVHIAWANPEPEEDSKPFSPQIEVEEVEVDSRPLPPKTIEEKILSKFGGEGELALAIAKAESGLDPLAMNTNAKTGDYSIGLYQINLIGELFEGRLKRARYLGYEEEPTREALAEWLQDEDNNIEYAYSMSRTNGWIAWSTYKKSNHLEFM